MKNLCEDNEINHILNNFDFDMVAKIMTLMGKKMEMVSEQGELLYIEPDAKMLMEQAHFILHEVLKMGAKSGEASLEANCIICTYGDTGLQLDYVAMSSIDNPFEGQHGTTGVESEAKPEAKGVVVPFKKNGNETIH